MPYTLLVIVIYYKPSKSHHRNNVCETKSVTKCNFVGVGTYGTSYLKRILFTRERNHFLHLYGRPEVVLQIAVEFLDYQMVYGANSVTDTK